MSIMEESNLFLELQINKTSKGTFGCQEKYICELLNWLNVLEVKTMRKKGDVILKFCKVEDQVVYIFTKALSKDNLYTRTGI